VEKICSPGHAWCYLLEKVDPLSSKRELKPREPRDIAARPREASNKTLTDWIAYPHEDYRYGAVACCNAATLGELCATITSGSVPTSSFACASMRLTSGPVQR